MREIKQLEKKEIEIREKINLLKEKEEREVHMPKLKKMVGKCFAYRRNSYSSPKKPSDCWDVFLKIIDFVDSKEQGFHFIVEKFQVDSKGKIELTIEDNYPYPDGRKPFDGYEEISDGEYYSEKAEFRAEMATQKKMRKVLKSKYNF